MHKEGQGRLVNSRLGRVDQSVRRGFVEYGRSLGGAQVLSSRPVRLATAAASVRGSIGFEICT